MKADCTETYPGRHVETGQSWHSVKARQCGPCLTSTFAWLPTQTQQSCSNRATRFTDVTSKFFA